MNANSIRRHSRTHDERMHFVGLDASTSKELAGLQTVLDAKLPEIMSSFYAKIMQTPELAALFRDEAHMEQAKSAQLAHWKRLFSGRLDQTYVHAVQRIGLAHARAGLEPSWYIGAYTHVVTQLIEELLREKAGHGIFAALGGRRRSSHQRRLISAILKSVALDMDYAISIYFEKIVEDRERATQALAAGLSRVSAKDLSQPIDDDFAPEFDVLKRDFNASLQGISSAVQGVMRGVEKITSGSAEVATASSDLARRTEHGAATLDQTRASTDHVTETVRETAAMAQNATALAADAKETAERGVDVIHSAIEAMDRIREFSSSVGNITTMIDEIAFQTNLLALNAGVEAARAGEAGKGFAVVATEVRALAQRSAEAAKDINALIADSVSDISVGVGLVEQTDTAFREILEKVVEIDRFVTNISSRTKDQSAALDQVNNAVAEMDHATRQNAAMAEEATAASQSLAMTAREVLDLVSVFKAQPDEGSRRDTAPAGRHGITV